MRTMVTLPCRRSVRVGPSPRFAMTEHHNHAHTAPHHTAVAQLTGPGAPFEVIDVAHAGGSVRAYRNAETNVRQLMAAGRQFGDALFVQYPGQAWSFNAFFDAVDALSAALLTDLRVAKGDRVAIAMRNRPEWLIAFTAIINIGAVVVPLNSWGKGEELQQGLDDSDARLVICDPDRLRHLQSVNSHCTTVLVDGRDMNPSGHHWHDLLAQHEGATVDAVGIEPEDPAILLFTSGTSGRPKGALFSHFNCCQALMNIEFIGAVTYMTNLDAMSRQMSAAVPPKTLLAVPLFHISGLFSQFVINLRHGRGLYMMYKWDAREALRLLREEGITVLMGAPAMMLELLSLPDLTPEDTAAVANISAGGSATPDLLHGLYREKTRHALAGAGWGMTETGGTGAAFTGQFCHDRPGASGFVSPIIELSCRDEHGRPVPRGEPGELWLRSSAAIDGYASGGDGTDFIDGWFKTGDVGYVSDEGLLYLSGRVKDLIIRGGENIYPAEVEACLLEFHGCLEAAVIGIDSPHWGEEVAAVLRLEANIPRDTETVRAHCAAHLAGFKVPAHIRFTDEPLPRNAVNKLLKNLIKDQYFSD